MSGRITGRYPDREPDQGNGGDMDPVDMADIIPSGGDLNFQEIPANVRG